MSKVSRVSTLAAVVRAVSSRFRVIRIEEKRSGEDGERKELVSWSSICMCDSR